MWGLKIEYGHKDLSGAVLRRATREGEVAGSNPVRRVAREYYAKNARLATCDVGKTAFAVGIRHTATSRNPVVLEGDDAGCRPIAMNLIDLL